MTCCLTFKERSKANTWRTEGYRDWIRTCIQNSKYRLDEKFSCPDEANFGRKTLCTLTKSMCFYCLHTGSAGGSVSYICRQNLHDSYSDKTHYHHQKDIVWQKIFLPDHAPLEFQQLQHLCDEIERAEVRWDARTARQFIGSLPNELPLGELVRIVHEFIENNFLPYGLCAIAATHRRHNRDDPAKNNLHVHIIVPTRPVGPMGFVR